MNFKYFSYIWVQYVKFIYDSLSISISYKDVFFYGWIFPLHIALNKIKYICISIKYLKHIRFIYGMNTIFFSFCVYTFNVLWIDTFGWKTIQEIFLLIDEY